MNNVISDRSFSKTVLLFGEFCLFEGVSFYFLVLFFKCMFKTLTVNIPKNNQVLSVEILSFPYGLL